MENKSSQGATLSPVKLWSGKTNITKKDMTLNIPNLSKYNVIIVNTILYGENPEPIICVKNGAMFSGHDVVDQNGGNEVTWTYGEDNILKVVFFRSIYNLPWLSEVWGIG